MRKWVMVGVIGGLVVLSGIWILTRQGGEPGSQTAESQESSPDPESVPPVNAPRADGSKADAAPSQESSSSDDVDDNLIEEVMETRQEEMLNPGLAVLKAKWAVEKAELNALAADIFRRRDATHRSMPKYRDINDEILAKAETLFDGVDRSDLATVLDLSQKELDAFWDMGGLSESEAYEHGYMARAVLELTMEEHGENFEFLSALREAINTMTVLGYSEHTPEVRAACLEETLTQIGYLWPIIDKQAGMLFSGEVEPSIEGMLVMFDWVRNTPFVKADSTPGWRWLIENAEAGGWAKILPSLEKGLQEGRYPLSELYPLRLLHFRHNRKWEMYTSDPKTYLQIGKRIPERQEKNTKEVRRLTTEHTGRILLSFKGSKEFQKLSRGRWEPNFGEETEPGAE